MRVSALLVFVAVLFVTASCRKQGNNNLGKWKHILGMALQIHTFVSYPTATLSKRVSYVYLISYLVTIRCAPHCTALLFVST